MENQDKECSVWVGRWPSNSTDLVFAKEGHGAEVKRGMIVAKFEEGEELPDWAQTMLFFATEAGKAVNINKNGDAFISVTPELYKLLEEHVHAVYKNKKAR